MSKTSNPLERYLTKNPNAKQSENLNLLDKYYIESQQQLDENREAATQKADIAYQKAKNYMPLINKQNGLSGLGVSETATLDMYNKHLNRQSGIDSSYDSASRDLFQNYLTDRTTQLDREYQQKKEDQAVNYQRLIDTLTAGEFSTFDELNNSINRAYWDGLIDESQYNTLRTRAEWARTSESYKDISGNTYWREAQGVNDPYLTDEQKKEKAAAEVNKATESAHPYRTMLKSMDKWKVVDLGGRNWFGGINGNLTVKAPNGENVTMDELYERLTKQEGMKETDAKALVLKLQNSFDASSDKSDYIDIHRLIWGE